MVKFISDRRLNGMVAGIAGLDPEMDRAAARVLAEIRSAAAPHNKEHDFARSFSVDRVRYRGVTDRVVSSDDPAALSIEYGHMTRRAKGRRLRKWVPGLMIVNEAVNKLR